MKYEKMNIALYSMFLGDEIFVTGLPRHYSLSLPAIAFTQH
jgi:hypothetical protein